MNFKEATDAISGSVSHSELAEKLGVSVQRIRQARLSQDADGYRPPPIGWQGVIVELAKKRGAEVFEVAAAIDPKMQIGAALIALGKALERVRQKPEEPKG